MTGSNAITDQQLDLLAEGELDRTQRDELFRQLDQSTDGWKKCALALLETQALTRSMFEIASRNEQEPERDDRLSSIETRHPKPQDTSSVYQRRLLSSAVAASLLMLLGGWLGWISGISSRPDPEFGSVAPAWDAVRSNEVASSLSRLNMSDLTLLAVVAVQSENRQSWVPVVQSPALQQQVLDNQPIALAPEFLRSANELGWHISRQQRLLAIEQPERETVIMPLETLSYRFVGANTF